MQNNKILDFTLLYNRHKKQLYNYLLKITHSVMLSEDITHNVFIKLYDNLSSIREPEKVEYWIFSTARNEALSYLRHSKPQALEDIKEDIADDNENSPAELCERNQLSEIIERELKLMDSQQSDVYLLKEYSGMSYREVAGVMNISEELVKSRLHKVREKLKTALLKLNPGEL